MSAHRLWMKSGASGRAVDLDHSSIDDHEDQNAERLDGKLNDHALQEQPEQRPQLIASSVSCMVSNADASTAVLPAMRPPV